MPAFSRFLRYFVVVGRLCSILRAAQEPNVSASAIDRQILNAGADLGLPLFTRLTDPVLRPMILALCIATLRTPSHAAGIVPGELEAGFARPGYPAAHLAT